MRRRLSEARVGHLATVDGEGHPHLVPLCFAVDGETIYFAVDAKPKRTTDLKRLRNLAANPSVSVLVDHYDEDWTGLWWVRADGAARVVDGPDAARGLEVLTRKYEQYQSDRPPGPVVAISIVRISGWAASGT